MGAAAKSRQSHDGRELALNQTVSAELCGEDDKFGHQPLYEAIVLKARELHLGGATVLRGPIGYGHSSRLHMAMIMRLSYDLPMVIEIVDTEAKIDGFLPELEK